MADAPDIVAKWGAAVAGRGFAQVPNYLLLLNQFLNPENRLSSTELLVLIQLVGNWWRTEEMPFPSVDTLAVRCGTSSRQIQRAVARLESFGLVRRVKRRRKGIIASNAYDLRPLMEILGEVAKAYPNEFPRRLAGGPRISIGHRADQVEDNGPLQLSGPVAPES